MYIFTLCDFYNYYIKRDYMKKTMSKSKKKDITTAYLMISPLVLGLLIFYIYPIFKVVYDSLHKVNAFNQRKWVGIGNYTKMINDPVMWQALGNTFKYVIVIVPGTIIIALILASMLNASIKAKGMFRVIYFIPSITMAAAISMVWKWMFNGEFGVINFFLGKMGIAPIAFLSTPSTVLYAISIVSIWMGIGYNMIILLAGIQGISKSYYEAATIDGATSVQQFFNITLPLVTPTLFFVMVTSLIATFQIFDTIYLMIPDVSLVSEYSNSMVVYFYRNAFTYSKKGYASALAVFLFLIIMLITVIQMKLQKKWVNYD